MASMPSSPTRRRSPAPSLRRTVSTVALLAGSLGVAAIASPASAQCVEGPPNSYTCSGQTTDPQNLVGVNPTVATTAGFGVNTTGNGDGMALWVTGAGEVSYTDLQTSSLTGAGVRFSTTGPGGLTPGSLTIFADGAITANGDHGLRLDNAGGGDTSVFWSGSINNSGGHGVFLRNVDGSSAGANLTVGEVTGLEDGVRIDFGGAGALNFTALGPLRGNTGSGLQIGGGSAGGDYNIQVGQVTGGTSGIRIVNTGAGLTRVVATGLVTGQTEGGIVIDTGGNTTGVRVEVTDVSGADDGVHIDHFGAGDVFVQSSGLITTSAGVAIDIGTGTSTGQVVVQAVDLFGGSSGVAITHQGTGGIRVTTTGSVVGITGTGIFAENEAGTTDISVEAVNASGGYVGIGAHNSGTGSTFVRATGSVAGGEIGIDASAGSSATDMAIEVHDVAGGDHGIVVENEGTGFTSIRSTGGIVAGDMGIDASAGSLGTDLTIEVSDVTGGLAGISIQNLGSGFTTVRSTGTVVGGGLHGISVENGVGSSGVLVDAVEVTGGAGIRVNNHGSGPAVVIAAGHVVGTDEFGVEAINHDGTGDLILDLESVRGAWGGVFARNLGTGETFVSTGGEVVGDDGDGISLDIGSTAGDVAVQTARTTGRNNGVRVANDGVGSTQIVLGGDTVGAVEDGVELFNGAQTTGLAVFGRNVQGGGNGLYGRNFGSGDTTLVFTGRIVGETQDGLRMIHGGAGGALRVDVRDVSGAETGVYARNEGGGRVDLTVRGLVEGGEMGVDASAQPVNDVMVTNLGVVRRVSGDSSEVALSASGDRVDVLNSGAIIGSVRIDATDALFFNEGGWNTAGGVSQFFGGDDRILNAGSGLIIAADDEALQESTVWSGLEQFESAGTLSLADGASGDTVRTEADTRFTDGSLFAVDIAGSGGSDLFQTFGTAEIQAGSGLGLNIAGDLTLYERYVVVQATEGLTGEFDFEEVFLTAFAGLRDGYTATTAFVEFAQLRDLADAAITPNQKETAAGADSLPDGNAVKDALILLPDDATAIDAFDQLSGEIHPSTRTAVVEASRMPREAVLDRLSDGAGGSSAWARAYGGRGSSDGDSNAARMDRDLSGFVVGADRTMGRLTFGFAASASETDVKIARRDSDGSVQTVEGLGYFGASFGDWRISGGVGYAETSIETRREIAFPGFAASPTAEYDGALLQGFVEAGRRFAAAGGHVEPFANLTVIQIRTDAFDEQGGGAADLTGEETRDDLLISTLGLRFETNAMGALSLGGSTGWRHTSGDVDPVGQHAFAGGAPFSVLGAARSNDAAFARVEARWRLSPAMSIGLAYDGTLGTGGEDHAITGGFKVVF